MEDKIRYDPPFLPTLLYFIGLLALAYVQVHFVVHGFVMLSLWVYQSYFSPKNEFAFASGSGLFAMKWYFLWLFLIYSLFLQIGTTALLTVNVFGLEWIIFKEAFAYGFHYILLFVETLWVVRLIHEEQRVESLQCFFYGNLFFLTLLWNGSIQQTQRMVDLKTQFDQTLHVRGVRWSRWHYIKQLTRYILEHMSEYTYQQIPRFQGVWKNKVFYQSSFIEKWLWLVPVLFVITAMQEGWIPTETYRLIQLLIAVVGIGMVYLLVSDQYEEMSSQRQRWNFQDRIMAIVLGAWFVFQIYQTNPNAQRTFEEFISFASWDTQYILSLGIMVAVWPYFWVRGRLS